MRFYILTLLIMLISSGLYAKNDCVVVRLREGLPVLIPLESASDIRFSDNDLVIGDNTFPIQDIVRYEFADTSLLGDIINDNMKGMTIYPDGLIKFPQGMDLTKVHLYDVRGVEYTPDIQGNTLVFGNVEAGIYVINIDGVSFKIVKK